MKSSGDVHVSVDLETLGSKSPTPVVWSIGAVALPISDVVTPPNFYVLIGPASAEEAGLVTERETLEFWAKQKPEATQELTRAKTQGMNVVAAFQAFAQWLRRLEGRVQLWSFPANFDLSIIRRVSEKLGVELPYGFRQEHCLRSLGMFFYGTNYREWPGKPTFPRGVGGLDGPVAHHALSDAIEQGALLERLQKERDARQG